MYSIAIHNYMPLYNVYIHVLTLDILVCARVCVSANANVYVSCICIMRLCVYVLVNMYVYVDMAFYYSVVFAKMPRRV